MEPFGSIVSVPAGASSLYGEFAVPPGEGSTVVVIARALGLAHPLEADQELARALASSGHATLIVDLVEEGERGRADEVRGDPGLLANRLVASCWWLMRAPSLYSPMLGLVGMPTAAEAVLQAASAISGVIKGLVVLGGRPSAFDEEVLPRVEAPTLFVVGGHNEEGIEFYREVMTRLHVEKTLELLEGAGEELTEEIEWEQFSRHADKWFTRYLSSARRGEHASTVLATPAE